MDAIKFCYWLQGYFDLIVNIRYPTNELTLSQIQIIKDKLKKVLGDDLESLNNFNGEPMVCEQENKVTVTMPEMEVSDKILRQVAALRESVAKSRTHLEKNGAWIKPCSIENQNGEITVTMNL